MDNKSGGSGNDTFDGSVNANGVATLTSVDQLNGGDGTDLLIGGMANGANIAPKLTSIEHMELIANNSTFDLINTTGLTDLRHWWEPMTSICQCRVRKWLVAET